MRILQVSDTFPPDTGGLEQVVRTLAADHARAGHESHVATLASHDRPACETVDGATVHRLSGWTQTIARIAGSGPHQLHPTAPDRPLVARLQALVDDLRPDVVHVHGWILHSVLSLDLHGAPLVMTAHDYGTTCAKKTLVRLDRIDQQCAGPSMRRCLPCARDAYGTVKGTALTLGLAASDRRLHRIDGVVAISETVRRTLPTVLQQRSRVIGSPVPQLPPPGEPLSPDPYVVFVGAAGDHKGLGLLRAAMTRVRAERPDLDLLVVSPAATPPVAPGEVAGRWIDGSERSTVITALAHAAVCVVPSRWAEPFGLVPLEALSLGTAVVVSDAGALAEVVGGAGLVAAREPSAIADAILAAIAAPPDPEVGRARAAVFGAARVGRQTRDFYRDLTRA